MTLSGKEVRHVFFVRFADPGQSPDKGARLPKSPSGCNLGGFRNLAQPNTQMQKEVPMHGSPKEKAFKSS